ncbi:ROK family protein [Flavihumibacter solisilvae]|uniref:ROK family transcriptional regulator n=1 Tax=Flavihumibacter solisilvae TaxID=1349421 RepID=A0A0C1L6V6_9BACT|nr:ROK family protein [Flavihumibacter solisilvae]KIC95867.1 ROK family transcriptional regulator [Flavihumibacter solisilvae]
MSEPIWGIDLGGTKIEGVILPSLDEQEPLVRTRVHTESAKGYDHIITRIGQLVDEMKSRTGLSPAKIGFGTPGVLDPVLQTMKNCNSTALNGRPLKKDLEEALGIPVVLANDANCFALSENHWGVVKRKFPGARMVFGIIMGTGVGGGIVMDGKIWEGRQGIAGEWGHIYLDQSGGPCYCGKSGCVETILSGPALQRYYRQASGNDLNLRQIVERSLQSDDAAGHLTLDRLHLFFGKAVSIVTNLLDPDVIVVGGGVGNIDSIYTQGIDSLRKYIFNNRLDVQVVKPELGDSAGVFGAAALVA